MEDPVEPCKMAERVTAEPRPQAVLQGYGSDEGRGKYPAPYPGFPRVAMSGIRTPPYVYRSRGVCRTCGGAGYVLVMVKGKATFRRHGSCGGRGVRWGAL